MWQRLSPSSRAVISGAEKIALAQGDVVSPVHLCLSLLDQNTSDSVIHVLTLGSGLKLEEARLYLEATLEPSTVTSSIGYPRLDGEARRAIKFAFQYAKKTYHWRVEPEHLLLGCLRSPQIRSILGPLGWNTGPLFSQYRRLRGRGAQSNSLDTFSQEAQSCIEAAYGAMRTTWCGRISTGHLLLGVLQNNSIVERLEAVGLETDELRKQTRSAIQSDSHLATHYKRFDGGAKRALERSANEAKRQGYRRIGPEHLLLALLPRRVTLFERWVRDSEPVDVAAIVLRRFEAVVRRALNGPHLQLRSLPASRAPVSPQIAIAGVVWIGISVTLIANTLPSNPPVSDQLLTVVLGGSIGAWLLVLTYGTYYFRSVSRAAFIGAALGAIVTVLALQG